MPGSPDEQDHLAFAVFGPPQRSQQDAELVLAPDQRRELSAMQRLEAAFGTTFAFDSPSRREARQSP